MRTNSSAHFIDVNADVKIDLSGYLFQPATVCFHSTSNDRIDAKKNQNDSIAFVKNDQQIFVQRNGMSLFYIIQFCVNGQ